MLCSEDSRLRLRLIDKRQIAERVVQMTFGSSDGRQLSAWDPGAHLEIELPSGLLRHYSLCGGAHAADRYTVAVLREPEGMGGSIEIHDGLQVGDEVFSSTPRNHFPLLEAESYLLIAGGIGITPLKAMIDRLEQHGANWQLVYSGKSRSSMAFAGELVDLYGQRVLLMPRDETGRANLTELIRSISARALVYCCGPASMIEAAQQACEAAGAADRLHIERFGVGTESISKEGAGFLVELRTTGETVHVEENQSILDAIRTKRNNVPSSCQEGYCGTCETRVIAGVPEHRGTLMSAEEHDAEGTMLICVGRALSDKLVLEL